MSAKRLVLFFIFVYGFFVAESRAAEPAAHGTQTCSVEIFISPFCGLSVYRLTQIIPRLSEIAARGGHVRFHLISMSGTETEAAKLRYVVCADRQNRLLPLVLYMSSVSREKRPLNLPHVVSSLGLNIQSYSECLNNSASTNQALAESAQKFFGAGLVGLPSVLMRDRGFVLTEVDDVLEALSRSLGCGASE